jgi:hypothetical protein
LAVDVIPRPGTEIGIFGRLQMNQLCRRLIDEGLRGAKEGQRAVGCIDKGREADGGGDGGRKKARVEAITNEGVPEFQDNIHDGRERGRRGVLERERKEVEGGRGPQSGKSRDYLGRRIINSARITPARNGASRYAGVLNQQLSIGIGQGEWNISTEYHAI